MSKVALDLSIEQLDELLDYDPETGVFRWKVSRGCRAAGQETGCVNSAGYVVIGVNGRVYYAHRLAWALVHREWPSGLIDQRDDDRANNRIGNLRAATPAQNVQHAQLRKDSTTGFKGVSYVLETGKWRATIGGPFQHLGTFECPEEAARAYDQAASVRFGAFAKTNFGENGVYCD